MDNIVYALKPKKYNITVTTCSFLQKPEQYTVYEGETFEDFCIGQFVVSFAENYVVDVFPQSVKGQFEMKQVMLTEWQEIRNTQNICEAYLWITFA